MIIFLLNVLGRWVKKLQSNDCNFFIYNLFIINKATITKRKTCKRYTLQQWKSDKKYNKRIEKRRTKKT